MEVNMNAVERYYDALLHIGVMNFDCATNTISSA
jgi:hypothetical protein